MAAVRPSDPEIQQPDPDHLTRIGGWLFEHRTLIPIPLAIPLLLIRVGEAAPSALLLAGGIAFVAFGEAVRLWGVRHIGAISRTRRDRLGPLITTGPFSVVRNPLYLGNVALWIGFAILARLLWMVPVAIVLLGFEYHAIVRWEERLLEARLGERYRSYSARVPRWMPTLPHKRRGGHGGTSEGFSWRQTCFSERGTLIAIVLASLALWLKFP